MQQTATNLAHTCTLIFREASRYAIRSWCDAAQAISIHFFGVRAHASNGEDLVVFLNTLL
jgi:predicted RNA-binding Zn ribbon-like protein